MHPIPPPFPEPFHYPGSSIDPARMSRGMGNGPYAAASPVTYTDYSSQQSSAGGVPVPQRQLHPHPPAHTPAWGSGAHPPASHTPAAHAPTIQRSAMPMPGHPSVFLTTMPMTGQFVNQVATPHHNPYAAQYIQGNLTGNRVRDDRGEQGPSEPDRPGGREAFRSPLKTPFHGRVLGRLRRPRGRAADPPPAEERCRQCSRLASRENAERLNGFCSDGHMWDAIQAGTATLCGACRRRACPPGRGFCSDGCGRG